MHVLTERSSSRKATSSMASVTTLGSDRLSPVAKHEIKVAAGDGLSLEWAEVDIKLVNASVDAILADVDWVLVDHICSTPKKKRFI